MWLRRILRTILELTIAIAIFIIIAQKTSLLPKIMNMLAYHHIDTALAFESQSPIVRNTLQANRPFTSQEMVIIDHNIPQIDSPKTDFSPYSAYLQPASLTTNYNYVPLISRTSCSYQWRSIPEWATITAYSSPLADNTNTCHAQTRTCRQGKLTGSYRYAQCEYIFDGKRNGVDIIRWASDSSHQTLLSLRGGSPDRAYHRQSPEYIQPITKHNYTPLGDKDVFAQGMNNTRFDTYRPSTVDALDQKIASDKNTISHASCTTPWGESVNHGSSIFAYNVSRSTRADHCLVQQRVCIDGKLSGSYQYKQCDFWLSDSPATLSTNRKRVTALYNYVF